MYLCSIPLFSSYNRNEKKDKEIKSVKKNNKIKCIKGYVIIIPPAALMSAKEHYKSRDNNSKNLKYQNI